MAHNHEIQPEYGATAAGSGDVLVRARAAVGNGSGLSGLDLSAMPQGELRAWGEALGRVRREVDVMLAKVSHAQAARSTSEDSAAGMSRRNGKPSPTHLIAGQTGGSEFDANRLIDVGGALDGAQQEPQAPDGHAPEPHAPEPRTPGDPAGAPDPAPEAGPTFMVVAAAVEAADISVEAASKITRMLRSVHGVADPEAWARAERELVAKAKLLEMAKLNRAIRQTEARLHRQGIEEREQEARQARYLKVFEDPHGMIRIDGRLDVETAAPVKAALDALVGASLRAKRDRPSLTPDVRTPAQMRADALALLARHVLKCEDEALPGAGTTVVIRMSATDAQGDLDASGRADDAGVPRTVREARVDGIGQPISAAAARRLGGEAGIVPVLLTADAAVLNLGRDVRLFTRAQKLALIERDGGCAMCGAPPSWCEAHHIREWSRESGRTDLDNGVMLCTRCHHDVHRQGWRIHATPTQVWFTPPASIDRDRRRRPGGRMLHDGDALAPAALEELERAADDATEAAASRRVTRAPGEGSVSGQGSLLHRSTSPCAVKRLRCGDVATRPRRALAPL
ncbi:HNH endonuclease signature motif containing protein [uncultured Demequina sp.]|uniref:HNH endonuclease signature motif containing protein n=1 Tax=uncultured Demequina sp. TaxID=693499 RepID=UPI0025FB7DA2|nr:HNH endonuclease signature motif containing protein [uncultured Demequina sp.]